MANDIGFEQVVLKSSKLIGYFVLNQNSPYYQSESFTKVLKYVQHSKLCKMKENRDKMSLTFENIKSVDEAIRALKPIGALAISKLKLFLPHEKNFQHFISYFTL